MFHFFVILGTTFVMVEALILLFWVMYIIQKNVSLIDIGWGLGFMIAGAVCFVLGEGYVWRKLFMMTVVSIWALRLTRVFILRISHQVDPRYQLLLAKWPLAKYPMIQVGAFYALQGLLITLLSLPFVLMSQNPLPFFSPWEVFGLLIWMGGIVGESTADRQLDQFKRAEGHAKQVCDQGLWKYSRHPNDFFEWIVWLGYGLMALSAPGGWLGLTAPLLMLYLLLKVSGIPTLEAYALQTKGEAYRDYQARTSAFIPWFNFGKSRLAKQMPHPQEPKSLEYHQIEEIDKQ